MSVGQWYVRRGRIDRHTYWLHYVLPILGAQLVANLIDGILGSSSSSTGSGPSEGW